MFRFLTGGFLPFRFKNTWGSRDALVTGSKTPGEPGCYVTGTCSRVSGSITPGGAGTRFSYMYDLTRLDLT
jgi:hypothetical protein